MRFAKMPAVLQQYGEPKSTLYWRIKRGEFPPSIKQGERSAAWIVEEIEALMQARAAGASVEEVRALVARLVADRQRPAEVPAKIGRLMASPT